MSSRSLIPCGVFEGAPCIELGLSDWDPNNLECLLEICRENQAPGIDLIKIGPALPWGSVELNAALSKIAMDSVLGQLQMWREVHCEDRRWSGVVECFTVVNASDLLDLNFADMCRIIYDGPMGGTDEVVITKPPTTVAHTILDEILGRYAAVRGYIYSSAEDVLKLLPAVCRTATRWQLRSLGQS